MKRSKEFELWKEIIREKAFLEWERASAMTENYAKAQRNKRDFDRTMNTLARENKMKLHLINTEQRAVGSGLLDLQSKSKSLSDTMQYIASRLMEEKKKAEEQLTRMSIDRSNARHGIAELIGDEEEEISEVRKRIGRCRNKIDWVEQPKRKATIQHSLKVVDLLTNKNKGFGGVLSKIRAKKEAEAVEQKEQEGCSKVAPKSPKDICTLIDHFKTLPKIYPTKPKKRKPKPTEQMMEKYAERKKERDKAMSYVTRMRLRRAEFHCETLKELFLVEG